MRKRKKKRRKEKRTENSVKIMGLPFFFFFGCLFYYYYYTKDKEDGISFKIQPMGASGKEIPHYFQSPQFI
jgi:hypothetical protein